MDSSSYGSIATFGAGAGKGEISTPGTKVPYGAQILPFGRSIDSIL